MPLNPFNRDQRSEDIVLTSMDRRIKRGRFTSGSILKIALLSVFIISISYAYSYYGKVKTVTIAENRLTISSVHQDSFSEYIPLTGNVEPQTIVYLEAIEGGQVTEVLVEEGSFVNKGDPLLKLKNTNLQLEVIGSEAQLTEQINNLNNTRLSYEQNRLKHKRDLIDFDARIETITSQITRREKLVNAGGATVEQMEDLVIERTRLVRMREATLEAQKIDEGYQESQMVQLNNAIDRMNENLLIARENLDSLTVKAPISGQLTSLDAHTGESKAEGQRLGQIDQVDSFKVTALSDEYYLSRVKAGQLATVKIDQNDYQLRVSKIYPEITNRQFEIDLIFTAEIPQSIRRGQSLQLKLEIGSVAQNLVLANGQYVDETGGQWVFLVSPSDSHAEKKPVSIGRRNMETVEVISGLNDGDKVITSSYSNFMEYDRINIQ